jgi:hypothetical protein
MPGTANSLYCTACGSANPTQASFCCRCGTRIVELAPQSGRMQEEAAHPSPPPAAKSAEAACPTSAPKRWWDYNPHQIITNIISSKIESQADAKKWITATMWIYLALGIIDAFTGGLLFTFIFIPCAICLKIFNSRAAAITLLVVSFICLPSIFFLGFSGFTFYWIIATACIQIAVTIRGVEATYKMHDKSLSPSPDTTDAASTR